MVGKWMRVAKWEAQTVVKTEVGCLKLWEPAKYKKSKVRYSLIDKSGMSRIVIEPLLNYLQDRDCSRR
jgi:hypothetical protein